MKSRPPKEVQLPSPLLQHYQGGAASTTVMQHSHDKFKSVFDTSIAGKRSLAGEAAAHRRTQAPSDVHPMTLMFNSHLYEDWFVIRFYSTNRNSALVGLFVFALTLVLASIINLNVRLLESVASYKVSLIIATFLSVASFVTAGVNALVRKYLQLQAASPKQMPIIDIEVVKKDQSLFDLFSWWEVSLVLAHLATTTWSFNLIVPKQLGCLGTDTLEDPANNRICTTTLQFDGLLLVPILFQGLVFPVRWLLHVPLTISMVVVFFGIRFLPQLTLSTTQPEFVMTTAFVFGIPIVITAVIRYVRERELRQLLLKELQLEATFHQLNVLTARHETLLTPWVPLPVEEQVKLLRNAHHGCHLWGLGKQTIVGMIHFRKFSSWVAKSGASEACRALCNLVNSADKFYKLISPLSDTLLKCHIDGDHYLLVCPDRDKGGFLLIVALLSCQEVAAAEGGNDSEFGSLETCAAVTSGLLGVAGIAASGTLAPAGPAMTRLLAVSRGCNSQSVGRPRLTVTSDTLRYIPRVPLHAYSTLTTGASMHLEQILHISSGSSPLDLSNTQQHIQLLEYVPVEKRQQLLQVIEDSTPLLETVVMVIANAPQTQQHMFPLSSPLDASSVMRQRVRALAELEIDAQQRNGNSFAAHESVAPDSTQRLLRSLDRNTKTNAGKDTTGSSTASQHPQEPSRHFSTASSMDSALTKPPKLNVALDVAQNTNFCTARSCFLLVHETFVDKDVEHRFMENTAQHVPNLDLLVASVASFAMGLFLVIICVVYGTTSMEVPGPMSCSVAAMIFGVVLTALSVVHVHQLLLADTLLAAHEFLFWCFHVVVIGTVYTGQPNTSPLGETQLVWMFMLWTINFVRPRAHGVLPHVSLDIMTSIAFLASGCIHPQHTPLMRTLNIVCAVAVAFASFYLHACLDVEERQKFVTETRLNELQHNLILKNDEINKILVNNRANNPAAIFAARA
ncbi:transmembrane protein, putative, partial [Bodo saltans]